MTSPHAQRFRRSAFTDSTSPRSLAVLDDRSEQGPPRVSRNRDALIAWDVWKRAGIAVTGWLLLLGLALFALSKVTQPLPPAPPSAPARSNVIAPGGIPPEQRGHGLETTR
jgi:hypothetical protein